MGLNIDKGILKSYLMLAILVALIGSIFILMYIWAIVGGAIFFTVENASLPVTNGTTNFLADTETSFFTNLGYVKTSLAFVGALIAVAIVLLVFGGFIKTGKELMGKKGKGKGGDMGY